MFSSKLILVTLAVLGLGGFGVAAAADGAKIADEAVTRDTPVITYGDTGNSTDVPDLIVDSKLDLTVNSDVSGSLTSTLTSTLGISGSVRPAIAIATAFSTTLTDVVQLHDSGWGYGEIYKLYELAKLTGMTTAQIQALRDSGMGWGQIETQLGVKHGNRGDNLGGIVSGRTLTSTLTVKTAPKRGAQSSRSSLSTQSSLRTQSSRTTPRNSQAALGALNSQHAQARGKR